MLKSHLNAAIAQQKQSLCAHHIGMESLHSAEYHQRGSTFSHHFVGYQCTTEQRGLAVQQVV